MSMIKKDCFWYSPDPGMGSAIDNCILSESWPWSCPCGNCEWYIANKNVKKLVAQLVGAADIYEEKYGRNDR